MNELKIPIILFSKCLLVLLIKYLFQIFESLKFLKLVIEKRQNLKIKNKILIEQIIHQNFKILSQLIQSHTQQYKINQNLNKINKSQQRSMSRVHGLYNPVNPDRVNPEFIGIGQKYSSHKKIRLESEHHRKSIQSNFAFTLKLNEELQRNLLEKQKQLLRLQQARNRHRKDIKHKLNEQQKRQRELHELKTHAKQQRLTIKQGIKNVRDQLKSQRLANKKATRQLLNEQSELFKAQCQAFKNQNNLKHKSVELSKKLGNQKVNQYFRNKNLQSYNNYVSMIQGEDYKSDMNIQNIRFMHSQMKRLEKKINKKQNKLKNVLQEINIYTPQCQNQRKVNFLATVSVFRPGSTSSSWKSKPIDVLRTSFNKEKTKQIEQTI